MAASSRLVPHLSQRDAVHLLGPDAPPTAYVVAALGDVSPEGLFPNRSPQALRELVGRTRATHDVVFAREGIVVLRRRGG